VGHRKPELAVYEFVMHEENLLPSETLFIDDKAENIAAAKALGWQAHQLTNRNKLKELLTELNIL
jgi:HAD superfamily hydrolase (TIGR01509 family)